MIQTRDESLERFHGSLSDLFLLANYIVDPLLLSNLYVCGSKFESKMSQLFVFVYEILYMLYYDSLNFITMFPLHQDFFDFPIRKLY